MTQILIKKILILIIFFFFEYNFVYAENKIVAKVNNKIITSYEIKNKINTELILRNLEINQSNIDKMKNYAVRNLIDLRLKEIEVSKYNSIDLNNIDISRQLQMISSKSNIKIKERFSINNLNYDIFIKELKLQNAWQIVINSLFQDKIKINEEELLKEINILKQQSANIKSFDLSEIEVSFSSASEKKEKIEKINKSIKEIGFDKTVSIYSESESVIDKGRLGFINEKSLSKEIFDNLKNLKEGNISDPIIQLNKITFLKINKIKNFGNQDFNIENVKRDLINKKRNNLLNLYSRSHLSKIKNLLLNSNEK